MLTLYIPSGTEIDTVWAYGPTTDSPAPHWYEFLDNGTTGAQIETNRVLIRVRDDDGVADGIINGSTLGLARRIPAVPGLRITLDAPGQHAVAWPSDFPNSARTYLEFTDGLSASNHWQFVPEVPVQAGEENRLIRTNAGSGRFYRLRGK